MRLQDINALRELDAPELIAEAIDAGASEADVAACPTNDSLRLLIVTKTHEHEQHVEVNYGPRAQEMEAQNRDAMKCDFAGETRIAIEDGREIHVLRRTKAHEEGGTGAWFCVEYWPDDGGFPRPEYRRSSLDLDPHGERDYYTTEAAWVLHFTTARSIEAQRLAAATPFGKASLTWHIQGADTAWGKMRAEHQAEAARG